MPLRTTNQKAGSWNLSGRTSSADLIVSWIWRALWLLWSLLIILSTTLPCNEQGPGYFSRVPFSPFMPMDIIANVLLYLPLGLFYARSRAVQQNLITVRALLIAAVLSIPAELLQLRCANRFASVTDVIANTAGAALGATAARRIFRL